MNKERKARYKNLSDKDRERFEQEKNTIKNNKEVWYEMTEFLMKLFKPLN